MKRINHFRVSGFSSIFTIVKHSLVQLDIIKNIWIFLIIFIPITAQSQENKFTMPKELHYQSAFLTMKDSGEYPCSNLNITMDSISYYNINKRLQESIALTDLNRMRVIEGNYGFKGAVLGFFAFQSYTLLFGNQDNSPYNYDKCGPIIGNALIGAGVGYVVGIMIPKWKTYYFHSKK
ncbi:MAG: hypothetical protein WCR42_01055 [bacterium]